MSDDLDRLDKLAEAADVWGEWAIWEDLGSDGFVHVGNADGVIPEGEMATPEDAEPNPIANCYTREIAEFISAANPDVVRALVQRVRDAVAERDAALAREAKVRELHRPDWSDWGIDHPEEDAVCTCGYNGSYKECPTVRALDGEESGNG